jgi:hypothetical protein
MCESEYVDVEDNEVAEEEKQGWQFSNVSKFFVFPNRTYIKAFQF